MGQDQDNPIRIAAVHVDCALRTLKQGGMVLIVGADGSGKTTVAGQIAAEAPLGVTVVEVDPRSPDVDAVPLAGAVVVTCGAGTGRYHEATAVHVARICFRRVPDVVFVVDRGDDGRPTVRGGPRRP